MTEAKLPREGVITTLWSHVHPNLRCVELYILKYLNRGGWLTGAMPNASSQHDTSNPTKPSRQGRRALE